MEFYVYKSLEWRRQFRIDEMIRKGFKPAEVLNKYVAMSCIGQDKLLGPCK